jgi:hypothetical protein
MPFQNLDQIKYYTFNNFRDEKLVHAVFTRHGGASFAHLASLNFGGTVGDLPENVRENRDRAFKVINRKSESIYDVWQVHGNKVVCATAPRLLSMPHLKADAIITDRPEVTLLMRFADCVPILLYDPCQEAIGLVHAGWKGTVLRVAEQAVQAMGKYYNSHPGDILAAIGPSIAAHHYSVGADVIEHVRTAFGRDSSRLLLRNDGSVQFDLWVANQLILEQAGVNSQKIENSFICTACNTIDWYSHRAENGKTGRFGVLIGLQI